MKKFLIALVLMMTVILVGVSTTYAADATTSPDATVTAPAVSNTPSLIYQGHGWTITNPKETAVVGFYNLNSGSLMTGVAHTFVRASNEALPKLSADLDIAVAQEVTGDKDTLGGIGVKLGYDLGTNPLAVGFAFEPSIGLAMLNDFSKYRTPADIFTHYQITIYGTVVLYKWN